MRYDNKEEIGVNAISFQFSKSKNWIFRPQAISDFGIDAHIERVVDGNPTGQKIELQIKTGESHVKETGDHFNFRFGDTHKNYWLAHNNPVLIVWYSLSLETAFWEEICRAKVQKAGKGNKISIPKSNTLVRADLDKKLDFILEKSMILKSPRSKFVTFIGTEFTLENLALAKIEMGRFEDMERAIQSINDNQKRVTQVLNEASAMALDYQKQGLNKNDKRVLSTSKRLRDQLTGMAKRNSSYCDELTSSLPRWIGAVAFVSQGAAFYGRLSSETSEFEQLENARRKFGSLGESILDAINASDGNLRTFSDPSDDIPEDVQKAFRIYAESVWKLKFEFEDVLEFIREKSGAMTSLLRKQGDG